TLRNRVLAELAAANANRMTSDLGDVNVGAPRRKTAWKAIAHELAVHVLNFREVVARHTATGDPSVNRPRNWTKDINETDENEDD
ncbi:MAG: hypothetical protein M3470_05430, partial [Chloroflexota bacterium]|nr:hypothetical protein [Chloroflexota bacterium]